MIYPGDSKAASNADLITGAVPSSGIDRSIDWDAPAKEAAEITPAALVQACNAATARGVNPEVIKALLPAYGAAKLSLIAADKRAAFIAEVGRLA
jgi:hypothetical protein